MITIFSPRLKGYLVFKHKKFGMSLIACDADRMVAISKALARI